MHEALSDQRLRMPIYDILHLSCWKHSWVRWEGCWDSWLAEYPSWSTHNQRQDSRVGRWRSWFIRHNWWAHRSARYVSLRTAGKLRASSQIHEALSFTLATGEQFSSFVHFGSGSMFSFSSHLSSSSGVGKTRNETNSHTHNNCKFLGAPQHVSERCSSYISYPEVIHILHYCQVRLHIVCFYCYDTWRGRESWLFSQPEARTRRTCFAGKLQPMVYFPSHTQDLRVTLANRWPLALLT